MTVTTIQMNGRVRFNLPVTHEGLTLRICTRSGSVALYASNRTTVPNSANYDWILMCDSCDGCELYIDPVQDESDPEVVGVRKRQVSDEQEINGTATV